MNITKNKRSKNAGSNLLLIAFSILLSFSVLASCEGPSGSEGTQGPEGPQGPVGPAGEDGSMIYSGQGTPGSDVGSEGDYYLNTNTGEMFGPKDSDGWGNPSIVLMGDDGEDGSQIYSGTGAPSSSMGAEGDYYLDKSNYELYGPKTDSGWGSPINLKGADGNANVTRYIFPGHDFSNSPYTFLEITDVESSEEMRNSSWNVYLIESNTYFHIPGVVNPDYLFSVYHYMSSGTLSFTIDMREGTGRNFDQIEIIRVESSSTQDLTKQKKVGSIIPDQLDISNYQEVADYYGFNTE